MASPNLLSLILMLSVFLTTATAQPAVSPPGFNCSTKSTCNALVDYVSPNTTTLARIQSLFQVPSLLSLVGVNSLPADTPPTYKVAANSTLRIPFPCRCTTDGRGYSDHVPQYVVVKDDGLFHIANDVFAGLIKYQQIQAVNNVKDANLINVGQKLWIPLPCSCDDVDGQKVVHYGHVVAKGSSVDEIAAEFGTTSQTLLSLNGMTDPKALLAGQVLDVPIKACSSSINSKSSDFPLVVANGTTIYTANNCVKCSCNPTNNYELLCEASGQKPTKWSTCPAAEQCSNKMMLGNSTSSGCNRTTCAYAGYNATSILTSLAVHNSCAPPTGSPSGKNGAGKIIQHKGWSWAIIVLVAIQLLILHK